jgi:hypothetical protein
MIADRDMSIDAGKKLPYMLTHIRNVRLYEDGEKIPSNLKEDDPSISSIIEVYNSPLFIVAEKFESVVGKATDGCARNIQKVNNWMDGVADKATKNKKIREVTKAGFKNFCGVITTSIYNIFYA